MEMVCCDLGLLKSDRSAREHLNHGEWLFKSKYGLFKVLTVDYY